MQGRALVSGDNTLLGGTLVTLASSRRDTDGVVFNEVVVADSVGGRSVIWAQDFVHSPGPTLIGSADLAS